MTKKNSYDQTREVFDAEILSSTHRTTGALSQRGSNADLIAPVVQAIGDAAGAWVEATREIACAQIDAETERLAITKRAEIQQTEITGHFAAQHHKLTVLKDTADAALGHGKGEQFDKLVDAICKVAVAQYQPR